MCCAFKSQVEQSLTRWKCYRLWLPQAEDGKARFFDPAPHPASHFPFSHDERFGVTNNQRTHDILPTSTFRPPTHYHQQGNITTLRTYTKPINHSITNVYLHLEIKDEPTNTTNTLATIHAFSEIVTTHQRSYPFQAFNPRPFHFYCAVWIAEHGR